MNEMPSVGRGEGREMQELLSLFDAPAYVRRARAVEDAWAEVVARCRRQRDEWLGLVRIRLGRLRRLAGEWEAIEPLLADERQLDILRDLYHSLSPRLRAPVEASTSKRVLRTALEGLLASIERFNRRWRPYLDSVDLSNVNRVRDGYNRYYVLEKECALRSVSTARQGFRPLPTASTADLETVLPLLPVPRLADPVR